MGFAITGVTCSQLRRLFSSDMRAPDGANPEATKRSVPLIVPITLWRKSLTAIGALLFDVIDAGFALATAACDTGAWLFEPAGPVTDDRVSTTVLPT